MDRGTAVGIVAPTPGSEESESGHIATYMIVNVLLQFHDEVHVFTRATAVMEFDHPNVALHTYTKPYAQSQWYLRLPGQVVYQLKYCYGIVIRRRQLAHVLFGGSGFIFPMLAAKVAGVFILYRIGGVIHYQQTDDESVFLRFWSEFLAAIQSLLYHLADEIIVISPTLSEFAGIERFAEKTSTWCHYYFDLEAFAVEIPYLERDNVVGQVGIVSEVKGSLDFVEAMGAVGEACDAKTLIVGDGPLLSEARHLADRNDLDAEFTGRVSRSAVPAQMNRMKVLVISSVSEGVPKVALEAMACGTIPLATNVGGISDFIKDGQNGFLVDSNDPETLADTIVEILEDENAEEISNAARSYMERNFSFESAVRGYYRVVNDGTPVDVSMPDGALEEPIAREL